jgi:hypothetical protein
MHVVDEMGRIVLIFVVLAGVLAGLLGCGGRTRSSAPRAISTLPARTPDGLVSIPWTLGGVHADTVSVRYNDSDCGYSFARTDAVESSQTVTIAVYDHYQPLGSGVACAAFLRIATAAVRLGAGLGGRTLVHAPLWRP